MINIAIFGAGGSGREILMLIEDINCLKLSYNFVGFFDDGEIKGQLFNGFPILGNLSDLNDWEKGSLEIVIGIGDPEIKKKITNNIFNPLISFPNLIHPSSIIGRDIKIGIGNVICARTVITVNVIIGNFVNLGIGTVIGHDSKIDNYCSIMPGVIVSGYVTINELVYIGTGVKIINVIEVGEGTIIGAGAVVCKNLPAYCTAVGVPAKAIKIKL